MAPGRMRDGRAEQEAAGAGRSSPVPVPLAPAPRRAALLPCGVTDGSLGLAPRCHPPAHLSPAQNAKSSKAKTLKERTEINAGITRDERSLL